MQLKIDDDTLKQLTEEITAVNDRKHNAARVGNVKTVLDCESELNVLRFRMKQLTDSIESKVGKR